MFPVKLFDTSLPPLIGAVTCWFPDIGDPLAGQYPTDEELGGVVGVNKDLIADADSFDLGVGVVSDNVSLDLVGSERLRLGGKGEELVGEVDGDLDVGPGSSPPLHQLQNLHASSDLLHHSIKALHLYSKLGSLASDDPERPDLGKATQLYYEILALYNEYDLTGIDVVDSELEWVKETGDKLRTEERGMKSLNQAEVGTGL
ncbi:oligomeric Golgi complex subunit 5-like [Pyrus ussuriensis x Pyrus communis]|uniref:Oligomeric Golgi complex subunit 5-like n=1 Tax=Pyrus ussuriensis x Pyrus communis TaxID=2448454 RepID=A0A5N5HS02_9ROSA|nr:oligomeric Golgi complex subunit 5-like [Pyrus ussuriensis x Pyrus communis]